MKITIVLETPPEFDKYLEPKADILAHEAKEAFDFNARVIIKKSFEASCSFQLENK